MFDKIECQSVNAACEIYLNVGHFALRESLVLKICLAELTSMTKAGVSQHNDSVIIIGQESGLATEMLHAGSMEDNGN